MTRTADLPFDNSIGYQIRITHRMVQRYLQSKIEPHGVTLGMWYFLRALWHEDGLTQRELSRRLGTMEPTTLTAIATMEKAGLVTRVRNETDRRKLNVFLTEKGHALKPLLLPLAVEVVHNATDGFSPAEVRQFLRFLGAIQQNVGRELAEGAPDADES